MLLYVHIEYIIEVTVMGRRQYAGHLIEPFILFFTINSMMLKVKMLLIYNYILGSRQSLARSRGANLIRRI